MVNDGLPVYLIHVNTLAGITELLISQRVDVDRVPGLIQRGLILDELSHSVSDGWPLLPAVLGMSKLRLTYSRCISL